MIGEPINFTTLCLGKFKWVSNKFQPNKFSLCCKMIGFSTFSFYLLLISCIRNKDLWAFRLAVKKTVFKPLIFISYFLLYLSLFSFSSKTSFSKFLVLSLSLSCLFPLITYLRFFFLPYKCHIFSYFIIPQFSCFLVLKFYVYSANIWCMLILSSIIFWLK